MTWNYRLVLRDDLDEDWYEVHEVYYNEKKELILCTENPISLSGESLEDVVENIGMILKDIKKHPILLASDLPDASVDEGEF